MGYAYKQLFATKYVTPVIRLNGTEMDNVRQTMKLMAEALPSCRAHDMLGHLVNYLTLRIADILHDRAIDLAGVVSRPDELFRLFRRMLAENYKSGHSISYYARRLNVSEAYLSRAVRKVSGKTINLFFISPVVPIANHELIFRDLTIKEIAEDLGFSDQSAFGKFFKKQSGLSPLMFRNSQTGRIAAGMAHRA